MLERRRRLPVRRLLLLELFFVLVSFVVIRFSQVAIGKDEEVTRRSSALAIGLWAYAIRLEGPVAGLDVDFVINLVCRTKVQFVSKGTDAYHVYLDAA